ncbi:MAG: radical SAM protein [bacterium]
MKDQEEYAGVETGPIRPPSEAASLYIRVSRNCPWNRCRFCPVYKGERFSRRPLEHVLRDVDLVADHVDSLLGLGETARDQVAADRTDTVPGARDLRGFEIARHWVAVGSRTIFLQDANALGAPYEDLLQILLHLKRRLPWVERVTSYARSRSILRLSVEQLAELQAAGLRRIHVGFESGSDQVLAFMQKGATKAMHAEAGLRVKQAGIELSAYYMPGLGGRRFLEEHALETADLVRSVEPDFLRLRSLAIPDRALLAEDVAAGLFEKAGDVDTSREILLFLEHVGDIPCQLTSDHMVNLMPELNGNLATRREAMIAAVRRFLALGPEQQRTYMVGRRLGVLAGPGDLEDPSLRERVEAECRRLGVTEQNVDALIDELVKRFV